MAAPSYEGYSLGMKVSDSAPAPVSKTVSHPFKEITAAVVSPFATAYAILLFVLAALEFLRPRFVSLFLDLRWIVFAALVFWTVSLAAETKERRGKFSVFLIVVIAVACGLMLYKLILPFGRLGLIALGAGAAALILAVVACIKKSNPES